MSHTLRVPAFHLERWVAGILLCLGLFAALYWSAVHTSTGQLLDTMMRLTAHGTEHPLPPLDPSNTWITAWILVPPAVACAALAHRRGPGNRWPVLVRAAVVVLGANLSTQVFKLVFSARPALVGVSPEWAANSLPSGHTTMAASAAAAAFLVAAPRERSLWGVLAALWGAGWGGYIFVEGWHRPSDMLAAYLVVAGWTLLGGVLILPTESADRQLAPLPAEPGTPGGRQAGMCLTLGLLGCAVGVAALFGPVLDAGLGNATESTTPWLWIGGAALSSAPLFLLFAALVPLFAAETQHLRRLSARGTGP